MDDWGNQMPELVEADTSKWLGRLNIDNRFYHAPSEGKVQPMIYWFNGPYRFLSNFWPVKIEWKGEEYTSTEHIYQAAKAKDDEEGKAWKEKIRLEPSPAKIKRMGGELPIRADWEDIKLGIMKDAVLLKFTLYPDLKNMLLNTGDAYLVEGTTWHDCYWGICINKKCKKGCDQKFSMNHLGRTLMEVRQEIR